MIESLTKALSEGFEVRFFENAGSIVIEVCDFENDPTLHEQRSISSTALNQSKLSLGELLGIEIDLCRKMLREEKK